MSVRKRHFSQAVNNASHPFLRIAPFFKPTLLTGKRPIIQKHIGSKEYKLIYDVGGSKMVKNLPVPAEDRKKFSITDDEILQLVQWACDIEDYFSRLHDHYTPMDMEWAKDGVSGQLFILQARPETVQSQKHQAKFTYYQLKGKGKVLAEGSSVGEKIAHGKVRVIKDAINLSELQEGEVLVTDKTDPDWEPSMKKAAAIATNRGGRTCHATIVSRELGLPAIVGTENGIQVLQTGQMVTVSWCLREKCERDHSLGYFMMKKFAQVMTERLQATRMQLLDLYGNAPHA